MHGLMTANLLREGVTDLYRSRYMYTRAQLTIGLSSV